MGPRAGLDGRKISSPQGFDPGPSSPLSVAIPNELPAPYFELILYTLCRHPHKKSQRILYFNGSGMCAGCRAAWVAS